ncbi:PspC domain-containing protein [Saccharopolyspora sp. MS10]|uniref:PspC domain-containing protein n=1 Tax=Saccharopolyspora sp. MS10 TaxID=3385973 RepID=UPI0039A2F7CD
MNGNDSAGAVLREMWETRPARSREGRKLAGVCTAIGRRYDIDPVLVRVAFVVATIPGGGGLALYLALWAVLPAAEPAPGDGGLRRVLGLSALVLLGLFVALPMLYPHGWLVFPAAVAALYLLHQREGAPAAPARTEAAPVGENTWVYPGAAPAEPPRWDPLGAAPFAWDLPEPPAEAEPEPPKRPWISWLAIGAAVLACAVVLLLSGNAAAALAVALGVLGAGMLAAAFLRGGRMLIACALPVGALAVLLGAIGDGEPDGPPTARDQEVVATAPAALRPEYPYISNGTLTLDLRQLRLGPDERVETKARVGNGQVRVLLPPGLDTSARCITNNGTADCLGNRESGGSRTQLDVADPGEDGPGGGQLRLHLAVNNGDVEVLRG